MTNQTASTATTSTMPTTTTIVAENPAMTVGTAMSHATNNGDTKQRLYDILTSDTYSDKKEVVVPKESTVENSSWFKDFLEWLSMPSSGGGYGDVFYLFSALLKGLLVLALLLFVYWVIKNADKITSWVQSRSWRAGRSDIKINDYRQSHLAQGWESLPTHEKIPTVVKQLLAEGEILPASSILYRGSLRWLNHTHRLNIRPANTELQCVKLIDTIRQQQAKPPTQQMSEHTASYVIDIIHQWIPIAYSSQSSIKHATTAGYSTNEISEDGISKDGINKDEITEIAQISPNTHNQAYNQDESQNQSQSQNQKQIQSQTSSILANLQSLADNWHKQLPSQATTQPKISSDVMNNNQQPQATEEVL